MTIYFTSDLHLDHKNIIKYCQRPFHSIGEMNAALIANWNARVEPGDTVYVIGDFALSSREKIAQLRAKLNGEVILIRGNHDRGGSSMLACGFDWVMALLQIEVDGRQLYLRHIPNYITELWNGCIHLCGHVHTDWRRRGNIINVGVDQWGFKPVTLEELLAAEQTDLRGRSPRRPVPS